MPSTPIQNILLETKTLIFEPCGFELTNVVLEKESKDYSAYQFELNALKTLFRVAKTTPTKVGQFVTLWKRIVKGPIQPFDLSDDIDLFVINTRSGDYFGQFVFPKSVLSQQGILSTDLKEGKRAIRVYPPWDITTNKQAQKTQKWQLDYFLEIPLDKPIDSERAKFLYLQQIK
ncbi:MepB family protein [Flavobacterium sp. LB1P62]|uniref:MepB family protein n=1 Tax=Flavobacterium sp. LB1P62 TaxID=3401715 RepID=UPI003AAE5EAD